MVNYQLFFTSQADKDKTLIKQAGLEDRARELLGIIAENPFQNSPPYEKLVGNLCSYYSRRINIKHRLVYQVFDNTNGAKDINGNLIKGYIKIIRMWTHYEKL